jgi:SnoaL-like protein
MTVTEPTTAYDLDGTLYQQIQNFYAYQMQLLDDGAVDEWAATFTEDGVFAANAHPEPSRGRAAIAAGAGAATRALRERKVQRRHWLGMLSVRPDGPDTVRARSYAVVLETPKGGQAKLLLSTVCVDLLVRSGDGWLVQDRQVTRDDLD